jgi:hypothetical protein
MSITDEIIRKKVEKYFNNLRIAFMSNGDRIRFGENNITEEVFSPRYGFNEMPENVLKVLKNCPYDWDFQGKYVHLIENEELFLGYQNNFFVMKTEGKWLFRTEESYLGEEDGFVESYIPPKPIQKFEYFQGIKLYRN